MNGEPLLCEAEFQERRRRVLRGMGALVAVFVGGLVVLFGTREIGRDAMDAVLPFFVIGLASAGLWFWLTLRRHWRCPACDVRWEVGDALASSHWNRCATCGASLRLTPQQTDRERMAAADFALAGLSRDELLARFLRSRRLGRIGAGAVLVAGGAALVCVQTQDWSDLAEQVVVALFASIAVAMAVSSARCPRCKVGFVVGKARHCQRCGLSLDDAPDTHARPDDEA